MCKFYFTGIVYKKGYSPAGTKKLDTINLLITGYVKGGLAGGAQSGCNTIWTTDIHTLHQEG